MADKEIADSLYSKKVKGRDEYKTLKNVTKHTMKIMSENVGRGAISLFCEYVYGKNIDDMSFSAKMKLAHDIDKGKIKCAKLVVTPELEPLEHDEFPGLDEFAKTSVILELLGFESLAQVLREKCGKAIAILIMSEKINEEYVKKIISEDRSKAKKGKKNRHHKQALHIAKTTWEKYPNASLTGLAAEIYAFLRNKWNDVPVVGTIERWLKESGLNPEAPIKNRVFQLMTTEREQI